MTENIPNYAKFVIASTSGMGATSVCFPLDVVKFRMQVSGELGRKRDHANSFLFAKHIVKTEGILGLYRGLSASILRQATYTGTRWGVYQSALDYFQKQEGGNISLLKKSFCGLLGGICGGFVGVPTDVAMTRMAIDGKLPPAERRNYWCVTDALYRIFKEEGFTALFRGTVPTICRAVAVNISQFVTYTQTKQILMGYNITGDTTPCHLVASVNSALISTICMLPPDVAKTRIQYMKVVDGKPEYKGILDVWWKLITKEGITAPWKGFTPLFIRNGPQGVVLFLLYENQVKLYKKIMNIQ
ncbi:hypothetical protein Trydic_g3178 [Trypoxylus dichotomus]